MIARTPQMVNPSKNSLQSAKLKTRTRSGFVSLLLVLLCLACRPNRQASDPAGHFEAMSPDSLPGLLSLNPRIIAEYEPSESVLVSDIIAKTMQLPYRELERAILDAGVTSIIAGPNHTIRPWSEDIHTQVSHLNSYDLRTRRLSENPESIWARDWAPMLAKGNDGSPILVDFNYLTTRPKADLYGQVLASKHFTSAKRLSVPLYLEGGNFLINSQGYCIVSSSVIQANKQTNVGMYALDDEGVIIDGEDPLAFTNDRDYVAGIPYVDIEQKWRVRTNELFFNELEIRQILSDYAGCRKTLIVPPMPHEPTQHVDVFLKFINDETILMSQLDQARIENLPSGSQKNIATAMLEHQKNIRHTLLEEGFIVQPVPMPLPHIPQAEIPNEVVVRSYINSLLIVTKDQNKTAIVPSFKRGQFMSEDGSTVFSYPYTDREAIDTDESNVRQIYEHFGYAVRFVNADWLVGDFGAIHCTTMQYPHIL